MEFINSLVGWFFGLIDGLTVIIEIVGNAFLSVKDWLSWLPSGVAAVLILGVAFAIFYQIFGR